MLDFTPFSAGWQRSIVTYQATAELDKKAGNS
jgi:hypothetical protein